MNPTPPRDLLQHLTQLLQARDGLKHVPADDLADVIRDWMRTQPTAPDAVPGAEVLETLAARALARARLSEEERAVRARLAAQVGSSLDDLEAIVQRQFEGATRDIAERHSEAVRLSRTRGIIESVLQGLGGRGATLEQILLGAGRAVSTPVLDVFGQAVSADVEHRLRQATERVLSPSEVEELLQRLRQHRPLAAAEPAAIGQVAQAASQAVQQATVNVQKILAVALEASHAADRDDKPIYYP